MLALRRNNGPQKTTPLLSNPHRVTEHSKPRSSEPENQSSRRVETSGDVNPVMLLVWGFVLFSFAALFFCGWLLWAKCHGH